MIDPRYRIVVTDAEHAGDYSLSASMEVEAATLAELNDVLPVVLEAFRHHLGEMSAARAARRSDERDG